VLQQRPQEAGVPPGPVLAGLAAGSISPAASPCRNGTRAASRERYRAARSAETADRLARSVSFPCADRTASATARPLRRSSLTGR
jgi:hypothetical protein